MLTAKSLFVLSFCGVVAAAFSAAAHKTTTKNPTSRCRKTIGEVTPTGPVPSLFVLNSDGATLADGKLVLTGVSPNSIVFADRPIRSAGHVMTAQFIQQWDEDKGNFIIDPPNATVSVLGGVGSDVSDAVVTLISQLSRVQRLLFRSRCLRAHLSGRDLRRCSSTAAVVAGGAAISTVVMSSRWESPMSTSTTSMRRYLLSRARLSRRLVWSWWRRCGRCGWGRSRGRAANNYDDRGPYPYPFAATTLSAVLLRLPVPSDNITNELVKG